MRFHRGAPPENEQFDPQTEGWRTIREPEAGVLYLYAIPALILLCCIWVGIHLLFRSRITFILTASDFVVIALISLILIPLHEIIHAITFPDKGMSSNTVLGVWLSKGLLYAHYDQAMPRNRFLLVSIMPYIVLGLIPTIIAAATREPPHELLFFSLVGSVIACGDFVNIVVILLQVPGSAVVRNKGWKTFWKPACPG